MEEPIRIEHAVGKTGLFEEIVIAPLMGKNHHLMGCNFKMLLLIHSQHFVTQSSKPVEILVDTEVKPLVNHLSFNLVFGPLIELQPSRYLMFNL